MPVTNLFPEISQYPSRHAQRQYVLRNLVDMAKAGTLYLTDCLAHPEPIRTFVAECILGHAIGVDNLQRAGEFVPQELLDYRVRIVSIPHMAQVDEDMPDGTTRSRMVEKRDLPISFVAGTEVLDESMTYAAAKQTMPAFSSAQQWRKRWINTESTDVRLPLQQAFWCLRDQGENVKRARSKRLQRVTWKVRELRPGVGDETRRGPGRPRKDTEATA